MGSRELPPEALKILHFTLPNRDQIPLFRQGFLFLFAGLEKFFYSGESDIQTFSGGEFLFCTKKFSSRSGEKTSSGRSGGRLPQKISKI